MMEALLNPANYHAPESERYWLSASQLLVWRRCEALAAARFLQGKNEWPAATAAMLAGKYLSARWAGDACLQELTATSPELFRRDGTLRAEFVQCEELYRRTASDPLFAGYMTGEHWAIFTGVLFGVPWKARIEVYNPERNFMTDLMLCRDFDPVWQPATGSRVSFYAARDAYLSLGLRQLLVEQATGRRPELYLATVTRQTPPDLKVLEFNNPAATARIARELSAVAELVARIEAIRAGRAVPVRCETCEYCRTTRVLGGCENAA